MQRVTRNLAFLELIGRPVSRQQSIELLKTATDEQINAISELSLNVLQKRIDLSRYYKSRLLKHADVIRSLADKEKSVNKRKVIAVRNLNVVSILLTLCLGQLRWLKNSY